MTRKIYHVTKTEIGWQAKLENGSRASALGAVKESVVKSAIEMAKNHNNSQVIIHKSNGRFQEERTYPRSIDPRKTKG